MIEHCAAHPSRELGRAHDAQRPPRELGSVLSHSAREIGAKRRGRGDVLGLSVDPRGYQLVRRQLDG